MCLLALDWPVLVAILAFNLKDAHRGTAPLTAQRTLRAPDCPIDQATVQSHTFAVTAYPADNSLLCCIDRW